MNPPERSSGSAQMLCIMCEHTEHDTSDIRRFVFMRRTVAALLLMVFLLSGCTAVGEYQRSIYDDDTKVVKQGDSYTFTRRIGNTGKEGLSLDYQGFSGKQMI